MSELKGEGITALIHGSVVATLSFAFPGAANSPFFHVELYCVALTVWYFGFYRPMRSFAASQNRVIRDNPIPREISTLPLLLASKPGRRSFSAHLTREFSIEVQRVI